MKLIFQNISIVFNNENVQILFGEDIAINRFPKRLNSIKLIRTGVMWGVQIELINNK